jgi:hypothetical protein
MPGQEKARLSGPFEIDLIGHLSHQPMTGRLEQLNRRDWQPIPTSGSTKPPRSGKRRFGSVSDTVAQVLSEASSAMRFIEVHHEVERRLGGAVARSSVRNVLLRRTQGSTPLFERVARGRYRLIP